MILILSDGGTLASDIRKQLDLYKDSSIIYFTDLKSAAALGSGNVIIGNSAVASLKSAVLR